MKTLNQNLFQNILDNIPSIEVSLNWSFEEGSGNFEEHIEINSYLIEASFNCYETGVYDSGDYFTAPSFTSNQDLSVDNLEINIYNEEGEEINLSSIQKQLLSNKIESSIFSL